MSLDEVMEMIVGAEDAGAPRAEGARSYAGERDLASVDYADLRSRPQLDEDHAIPDAT